MVQNDVQVYIYFDFFLLAFESFGLSSLTHNLNILFIRFGSSFTILLWNVKCTVHNFSDSSAVVTDEHECRLHI